MDIHFFRGETVLRSRHSLTSGRIVRISTCDTVPTSSLFAPRTRSFGQLPQVRNFLAHIVAINLRQPYA